MNVKTALFLSLVLFFGVSCGSAPNAQGSATTQLASGKRIKISEISPYTFKNGETALVMSYETETPIDDKDALSAEAEEIWTIFKTDVEKAGHRTGILRAVRYEGTGVVRDAKKRDFRYEKQADGSWQRRAD